MQLTKVIAVFVVLAVLVAGCTSPSQGPTSTPNTSSSPVAGVSPSGTQVSVAPAPAASPSATVQPTATPRPTVTSTPSPTATPTQAPSTSLLEGKTWLTLYGRAWEIAPILGRLGSYKGTADMAAEIGPWMDEIKTLNGGKEVVPVLHLIYAMAIPCEPDNHCLLYLDTAGEEIVEDYIKPAAERGWQVILDSQMGSSNPVEQVQRMIDRGYLDYPNVHVALDPEFNVYPGEDMPGIPIGQLAAADLNDAQQLVNDLVQAKGLPKKVFMVHQFGDPMVDDGNPFMITEKKTVKALPNVEFVIDADGFGAPGIKAKKYNLMTDPEAYPFVKYRAIKLFFYNPYEEAHHADTPVMTWPQVFGTEDAAEGIQMEWKPDIIVVA